jgi:hypothetical protein
MDAILGMIEILAADTASGGIVSLVGNNVYGGQLPEHYNPEVNSAADPSGDGPAITIIVKGGTTHPEMPLQNVDVQLTVWAGVNQNFLARTIYERLLQVLHGLYGQSLGAAGIAHRILATIPAQDLVDQDTGWVQMLCAFNMMLGDNNQYPVDVAITPAETAAQYTNAAIAAISDIDGNGNFS